MNPLTQGAAKRQKFSLRAALAVGAAALPLLLGGCAVYPQPVGVVQAPYAPYVVGTDANGQPVYGAPPVYAAPGPYPYSPYAAYPNYYDPLYIGPPLFLNFGIRSGGGYRNYGPGWRGGRGVRGAGGAGPGRRHR